MQRQKGGKKVRADGSPWLSNAEFKKLKAGKGQTKKGVKRGGNKQGKGKSKGLQARGNDNARNNKSKQQVMQVLSPSFSNQQVSNITVMSDFLVKQLRWAFIGVASYLAQKGMVSNEASTGVLLPYKAVYDGLSYLLSSINTMIQGGTVNLNEMPKFALDYIAALKPKGVKYHEFATVQYSWNAFPAAQSIGFQAVGDGNWEATYVADDLGTYNDPAVAYVPVAGGDADEYAPLVKLLGNISNVKALTIVPTEQKSVLENDASSFARVYRYNGLTMTGPQTGGGYYKDAENEVNITAPMFCNFCDYIQPDIRVPAKLIACSGDAQSNLGKQFAANFTGFFNKVPTVYKQIDFEEIYTFCCLWMCKLKESVQVNAAQAPANNIYAQSLPFSQQDFRIMLRQALLNVFDSQAFVQGIGLTQYSPSTNAFVPFMVTGHSYGATPFNQFLLPQLIVENLNALKSRSLKINSKTSSQSMPTFVPVLGRYWQDDPATFQYELDGIPHDLFTTLLPTQNDINLTDGYMSDFPGPYYVNLNNGYYQGIMQDWNGHVQGLSGESVKTCPIVKDGGAVGLGVLYFTRIEDISVAEVRRRKGVYPAVPQYQVQSMRYLKNPPDYEKRKSCEKVETLIKELKNTEGGAKLVVIQPTFIPPATITNLSVVVETSIRRLLAEEEAFLGAIITPVARLSDTEDAVTVNMYQMETTEALTTYYTSRASTGVGIYAKMASLAGICVTGLGKDVNNSYVDIMSQLENHSKGGFLAGILGGFVKSFIPGSDGIVDTIANLVPF